VEQTVNMPLRGVDGKDCKWCAVCKCTLVEKRVTLRMHLTKVHGMEVIPGCPRCFHYRFRWRDVQKHCKSHHGLVLEKEVQEADECRWGLCVEDTSGRTTVPCYLDVDDDNLVEYPLPEETLSAKTKRILSCARLVVSLAVPKEETEPTPKVKSGRKKKVETPVSEAAVVVDAAVASCSGVASKKASKKSVAVGTVEEPKGKVSKAKKAKAKVSKITTPKVKSVVTVVKTPKKSGGKKSKSVSVQTPPRVSKRKRSELTSSSEAESEPRKRRISPV